MPGGHGDAQWQCLWDQSVDEWSQWQEIRASPRPDVCNMYMMLLTKHASLSWSIAFIRSLRSAQLSASRKVWKCGKRIRNLRWATSANDVNNRKKGNLEARRESIDILYYRATLFSVSRVRVRPDNFVAVWSDGTTRTWTDTKLYFLHSAVFQILAHRIIDPPMLYPSSRLKVEFSPGSWITLPKLPF